MADGFGFGAEGDWKTAVLLRAVKSAAAGLPGGTSFMEDYTYHLEPGQELILGAHMLEICPSIAGGTPSCEIHPLSIGGREDPVRLVFDAAPGPAIVVGLADLGDRFRLVANEIDVVTPPAAAATAAGGPRGVAAAARSTHLDRGVADGRRPAPHRVHLRCQHRDSQRSC